MSARGPNADPMPASSRAWFTRIDPKYFPLLVTIALLLVMAAAGGAWFPGAGGAAREEGPREARPRARL